VLDFATCDAARLRRDATFDGVFFTAVRTTGIYCRPICPARPAAAQVAATWRVQHAKQMVSDTRLPISEIAFRAGFQSIRRFNTAFLAAYGRSPSSLRRPAA
jgi:methylphosphotriester-DNA--protein-cysteine methyltransferase